MSDTSQGGAPVVDPNTVSVAFTADQGQAPVQLLSNTEQTFGPGVEAPRAIQQQEAARAAAAAAQQHPQQQAQGMWVSEADLNRFRSEANDKVYTQMNEMRTQLQTLQQEREEAAAAATKAEEEAAAAARAAEEEGMSAKKLVEVRTAELQQQLDNLAQEKARSDALLEREREFAAFEAWKAERVQQEDVRTHVAPQLLRHAAGSTQEEFEASLQELANTSTAIFEEVATAQAQARQLAPGVSTRAPGALSAPTELANQQRQLSDKDIQNLSPADYARLRPQLLAQKPAGW